VVDDPRAVAAAAPGLFATHEAPDFSAHVDGAAELQSFLRKIDGGFPRIDGGLDGIRPIVRAHGATGWGSELALFRCELGNAGPIGGIIPRHFRRIFDGESESVRSGRKKRDWRVGRPLGYSLAFGALLMAAVILDGVAKTVG